MLMSKQLTEEQRLSKAVVAIMGREPALAGVLMIGTRVIEHDNAKVQTACTNGRDEWYGAEFVAGLNDPKLRLLVLHENYHKMYRHLTTWAHLSKIDPDLANRSMDYVINIMIMDAYGADGWVEMIEGGCYDAKYRGWDTAKVFNDLRDNTPQGGDKRGPEVASGKDLPQKGVQPAQGFDSHDWEGATEMDAEEVRELARDIDEAVRQGAMIASKTGSGSGNLDLEELMQPQINWRDACREFFESTCRGDDYSSYQRPNRRGLQAGDYLPSGITDKAGVMAVHMDMSGSIRSRERTAMLTEVVSLAKSIKPSELHVLYWDTKVTQHEVYTCDELDTVLANTKPTGGGGTDVLCVPEYMQQHNIKPKASVVLTDGDLYRGWGTWDHPLLWCVLDNKDAKPDVGKVVHIKTGDM